MAGFFTWIWDYLLWLFWATEMDVTIVGLQNAGKTSLLRVLAVRSPPHFLPEAASPSSALQVAEHHIRF